mmetsp:Transcript_38752/g.119792  ORF Transcript_38752/g.119792 Transcript_38752/m.119792 type:complete len:495 (-) Transcript_38752:54-1538(-)
MWRCDTSKATRCVCSCGRCSSRWSMTCATDAAAAARCCCSATSIAAPVRRAESRDVLVVVVGVRSTEDEEDTRGASEDDDVAVATPEAAAAVSRAWRSTKSETMATMSSPVTSRGASARCCFFAVLAKASSDGAGDAPAALSDVAGSVAGKPLNGPAAAATVVDERALRGVGEMPPDDGAGDGRNVRFTPTSCGERGSGVGADPECTLPNDVAPLLIAALPAGALVAVLEDTDVPAAGERNVPPMRAAATRWCAEAPGPPDWTPRRRFAAAMWCCCSTLRSCAGPEGWADWPPSTWAAAAALSIKLSIRAQRRMSERGERCGMWRAAMSVHCGPCVATYSTRSRSSCRRHGADAFPLAAVFADAAWGVELEHDDGGCCCCCCCCGAAGDWAAGRHWASCRRQSSTERPRPAAMSDRRHSCAARSASRPRSALVHGRTGAPGSTSAPAETCAASSCCGRGRARRSIGCLECFASCCCSKHNQSSWMVPTLESSRI